MGIFDDIPSKGEGIFSNTGSQGQDSWQTIGGINQNWDSIANPIQQTTVTGGMGSTPQFSGIGTQSSGFGDNFRPSSNDM